MKNSKSYTSLFIILLIVTFIASACGDDDLETPPNETPVISDQSFTVAEGINHEVIIGSVQASDPDGDALGFSITATVELNGSRDFSGLFEIDETTGALSLANSGFLDFEDASGFTVTVSVSDMESSASASITITVTDVVEGSIAFVTTWRADENTETVGFLPNINMTYDYTVDWGDGTVESNLTGAVSHTYATRGDYQVSITGTFPHLIIDRGDVISIDQWGNIEWQSMSTAFEDTNVIENASDAPDLSKVTSLSDKEVL
mgnify:CR=1 FL=1